MSALSSAQKMRARRSAAAGATVTAAPTRRARGGRRPRAVERAMVAAVALAGGKPLQGLLDKGVGMRRRSRRAGAGADAIGGQMGWPVLTDGERGAALPRSRWTTVPPCSAVAPARGPDRCRCPRGCATGALHAVKAFEQARQLPRECPRRCPTPPARRDRRAGCRRVTESRPRRCA